MGRQQDLDYVLNQLQEVQSEIQAVNAKYQTYHQKVEEIIRGMLEKKAILERFQKLTAEREAVRQKAQQKINELQAKGQKLNEIRSFLLERASEEGPESPDLEEGDPSKERDSSGDEQPDGGEPVAEKEEAEEVTEDEGPPKPDF